MSLLKVIGDVILAFTFLVLLISFFAGWGEDTFEHLVVIGLVSILSDLWYGNEA